MTVRSRNILANVKRNGFWHDRRAAAALEFAIISVPLITLGLGTMEWGRLLWTKQALQQTATAGARCMGVFASSCSTGGANDSTKTTTYISGEAANWGITLAAGNMTLSSNTSCGGVSGFSQVQLTYSFTTVLPVFMAQLDPNVSITVQACFPVRAAISS